MLAQTKQGMVKGVKDGSIYVFKGIPYAYGLLRRTTGNGRYCSGYTAAVLLEEAAHVRVPTEKLLPKKTTLYSFL